MSDLVIRPASEKDRLEISRIISCSFKQNFHLLSKDMEKITKALKKDIQIQRFYVAESAEKIVGVAACSYRNKRAVTVTTGNWQKHLGWLKGSFMARILRRELTKELNYPKHVGFIEFVAVAETKRGGEISGQLLTTMMDKLRYRTYVLDVIKTNHAAIKCYQKTGFKEMQSRNKRGRKVYMKYVKRAS